MTVQDIYRALIRTKVPVSVLNNGWLILNIKKTMEEITQF